MEYWLISMYYCQEGQVDSKYSRQIMFNSVLGPQCVKWIIQYYVPASQHKYLVSELTFIYSPYNFISAKSSPPLATRWWGGEYLRMVFINPTQLLCI